MRGMVVFAFSPLSARSVTSGVVVASPGPMAGAGAGINPSSISSWPTAMRSMPVRTGARGCELKGTLSYCGCALTTGRAARRLSSSFCIFFRSRASRQSFFFARTCCQSFHLSQSAIAKANLVGTHTCNEEKEKAVDRYSATASTVAQTMYAPAALK